MAMLLSAIYTSLYGFVEPRGAALAISWPKKKLLLFMPSLLHRCFSFLFLLTFQLLPDSLKDFFQIVVTLLARPLGLVLLRRLVQWNPITSYGFLILHPSRLADNVATDPPVKINMTQQTSLTITFMRGKKQKA